MSAEVRPRFIVFIAISADGYIARSDGGIDWLSRVQLPGEDYGYQAMFDSIDTLVIGRNTHAVAAGFTPWPYSGKRVIVLTHRPLEPKHGEEVFAGEPAALAEKLGRVGAKKVYVDGGVVIRQFLAAKLIDELTLSVVPILLGSGIRLFDGVGPEQALSLESSRSWSTGLTQLRYRLS